MKLPLFEIGVHADQLRDAADLLQRAVREDSLSGRTKTAKAAKSAVQTMGAASQSFRRLLQRADEGEA